MAGKTMVECGRVFVAKDYTIFGLVCVHCKAVYMQWEMFAGHMKKCRDAACREVKTEPAGVADENATSVVTSAEWQGDEDVEFETLADGVKQQVEQLYVKGTSNGAFDDEPEEVVAAWPFNEFNHEDVEEIEKCSNDSDDNDDGKEDYSEDYSVAESGDDDGDDVFVDDNDMLNVGEQSDDGGASNDVGCSDDNVEINRNYSAADQSSNEQERVVCGTEKDELQHTPKKKLHDSKIRTYADLPKTTVTPSAEKQTVWLSFALTPAHIIEALITHVKRYPCLWKSKTKASWNLKQRNEALQCISDALNITHESAAKSVRYLLSWYTIQYHKRSGNSAPNADSTDPYVRYYKMCEFLAERMEEVDANSAKVKSKSISKVVCPYCGKHLVKRTSFVHIQRHTQSLSFKCDVCGMLKKTADELRTHMRVHTNEKPYVCLTCGKKYKTSSALCGHKMNHEEPSFRCTECPKAYRKQYLLKNHMNVHLNRRPFQCKDCLKTFTTMRYLYIHTKPVLRCAKSNTKPNTLT